MKIRVGGNANFSSVRLESIEAAVELGETDGRPVGKVYMDGNISLMKFIRGVHGNTEMLDETIVSVRRSMVSVVIAISKLGTASSTL